MLCGGQYTIERYLNSGGFGVTYLAADSLGRRVVIKECFPSAMCCRSGQTVRLRSRGSETEFDAILELFEKEARALAALQHPYIVGVHQYFRDNHTAYMAMDYVEGRTLLDIIESEPERLTPRDVKRLLIQILQAVGYIHSHDILHRDISPDNILIDADNLPVLIDFGAAREGATRVSRVLSKVLTVKDGYSPQEFYLQGSDQVFSSDLYALAATFYHVVGRTPPPSSHTRMAAVARDMADPLTPLGSIAGFDDPFIEAINTCLSMFPNDRLPSADAWRDRIDQERRKRMLLAQAEEDRALEAMIAQLVAEYRRDVADAEARAADMAKERAEDGAKDQAKEKTAAKADAKAKNRTEAAPARAVRTEAPAQPATSAAAARPARTSPRPVTRRAAPAADRPERPDRRDTAAEPDAWPAVRGYRVIEDPPEAAPVRRRLPTERPAPAEGAAARPDPPSPEADRRPSPAASARPGGWLSRIGLGQGRAAATADLKGETE
jgi:non-specific serine/threonine protein kinase